MLQQSCRTLEVNLATFRSMWKRLSKTWRPSPVDLQTKPSTKQGRRQIKQEAIMSQPVDAMLQNLFQLVKNEAQYALDFKVEFDKMESRLDLMIAFMIDTENLKNKNEVAKAAIIKLRGMIYDADNVLTDCIVRDEYKKYRSCFHSYLSDPLFLYKTGKKLKDINTRIEQIEKSLGSFQRDPHHTIHTEDSSHARGFMSQDSYPSETVGLEADLKKIKGWILDTQETLLQIAIVGMGGLGKTTIAQKIFHDNEVLSRFDKIIWVTVSRAFREEHVLKRMLERLGKKVSGFDSSQLLGEFQQVLADKTCLIVMDDVWEMNMEWWTTLCSIFPRRDGKSSCIIITTRNENVANDMGIENSRIHKPDFLNYIDSWSLFSKFAFSSNKGICPNPKFEKIGKDITKKCGGLPLAIKTIGALLAPKIESLASWTQTWESFHDLTTEGRNKSVMASLQLSYDELPSHLKQCLLSFSIYPEDFEVRTEQLIHWWVGEGLIQGKGSKSAIEMGYEYLLQLVKRCLVEAMQQRRYDGRIYNCKIHDMVRELISMNAQEEAFCSFDEKGQQRLTEECRWLGFSNAMQGKPLGNKSKIRALILLVSNIVKHDLKNFGSLTSLRVLDISNSNLKEINAEELFKWISSLKRLANLNLAGVRGLESVPSSIRKLLNLQLLVLTKCVDLKSIHPSITTLRRLILLDSRSCPLENLPRGLGGLSNLQELSGFMVMSQSKGNCCQLIELGELKQMRVLRINLSDDTEVSENELNVLAHLENLKVLGIDAGNCKRNTSEILKKMDRLVPPPALQELYLRNYRHSTLPLWVCPSRLTRLQYLSIENGDLINLAPEVEDDNHHIAWNIEGLCLKFLARLDVNWTDLQNDMPVLRYMEVSHCYKLKGFPCSVKSQSVLEKKSGFWRKN
ncbi:disease resistance RPP13-like protein 4 isoform X1 [Ziziphus jujuba]|uniref:Disease resistance RPP13-like protein 4 isoform X1 n=1 Tax=Ziziphus jujuba TaxID=326968 RepID=A0ABM4A9L2_ZIZJJ|nr:disease resistance RPP13-like protein 4 isoform X1 [Ziziphus jujuba var. spinosa]XP_060673421.1 disease resistance RPP13-like protein 4 isoform X1 [Ziziphus jujuba]XP_060673422.1 disease resistance RPP13-like protein 4 isoform X1 [Ziziphus jujuba]XP_060673423.1 disease resistance RPP13-like protein 4 isoform X1 [Ziziphus jujuba]XP_060673425.1 disease resistance RPP13-like protein 4 isoform X1 [Ziziphus jujuba]XP_060673426.1 disease resistance RPP13-like protein 4 isoform X1 [Ziziphus jujuba